MTLYKPRVQLPVTNMNFIRRSLLGGVPGQGNADPGRQTTIDVEGQPYTQNGRGLFGLNHPALATLFSGRPGSDSQGQRPNGSGYDEDDGPKSPAPGHYHAPHPAIFGRLDTQAQGPTRDGVEDGEAPSRRWRARAQTQRFPVLARPSAIRTTGGGPERPVRRSTFDGSGPVEFRLTGTAESGRRRQRRHRNRENSGSSRARQHKEPPKRFLFCFPWVKSRRARSLILRCFVSGIFLISMLTVYLSLSITKNINTGEFSILLIVLILLTTIFFCHGLILLCMLLVRPRKQQGNMRNDVESGKYGHPGYAIPVQPIRVVLARDEEAAGIESETAKLKPPAYGLWRESVRVDPNRIYWQRAGSPPPPSSLSSASSVADESEGTGPRNTQRRPPSYASDDGIDYVVDVRPRFIAPPPSSVYSQTSTTWTAAISDRSSVSPLPRQSVTRFA